MDEFKIIVETGEEVEGIDRFAIEDAVTDALEKLGYDIESVKVVW